MQTCKTGNYRSTEESSEHTNVLEASQKLQKAGSNENNTIGTGQSVLLQEKDFKQSQGDIPEKMLSKKSL